MKWSQIFQGHSKNVLKRMKIHWLQQLRFWMHPFMAVILGLPCFRITCRVCGELCIYGLVHIIGSKKGFYVYVIHWLCRSQMWSMWSGSPHTCSQRTHFLGYLLWRETMSNEP